MKTTLLILLTALPWMASTVSAAEPSDRVALTIICDTRWAWGGFSPELRTLARQGLSELEPGDCVEIISAHPSRPRLRLAQTVYRDTARQITTIDRVLAGIHAGFLTDAKISNALSMALSRLERFCTEEDCPKAVVVILSNGHLSNGDVEAVLQVAAQFNRRDWPLYITGNRGANRNLLMAGNQGTINFVPIGDANPALWLREARKSLQAASEEPTPAPVAKAPVTPPVIQDVPPAYTPFGSSNLTLDRPDLALAPGLRAQQPGILTRTEVEVTISDGSRSVPAEDDDESVPTKEPAEIPTVVPKPNEAPETANTNEPAAKPTPTKPARPLADRVRHWLGRFWPWLLAGVGTVVLTGIGYWLARDREKAKQIRTKIGGYLKKKSLANDGMLVATINGQTRHLGRLSRLRPFYVGSGAKSALRIAQKGINDRHLCLYQKAGRLMVQNLSRNPVTVAGTPLAPKGKRGTGLPAVIELTRDIKLRVALAQPKPSTTERSKDHAQANEIQKAAATVSR